MSDQKIADVPVVELPAEAVDLARSEPPSEGAAIVVADTQPAIVAKPKRKHRRKVLPPEGGVDAAESAAAQPAPAAEEEPKPPLSTDAIATACRTLLVDYLTGTAKLPAAEAAAAADRAVRALVPPQIPAARDDTKLTRLVSLLRRREGATIAELAAATGWQAHSVRGALSGTLKKKMGLAVTSEAAEGGRIYRLPPEG